uniref:ARAD1C18238p n=1 Tax=Blastobotrys adeninivorans TaxID=409370 RepID=A0A060T752_BLAAD
MTTEILQETKVDNARNSIEWSTLHLSLTPPHRLPLTVMRAGTSRGLFLHRNALPHDIKDWKPVLLAAIGSIGNDERQLDGLGGGTSTTSKVAVISKSKIQGIDIEYTFIQLGVGEEIMDMTGTCGNMLSGVGPFALDEGLVTPTPGQREMTISIWDTNTRTKIFETFEVTRYGKYQPNGDTYISGVKRPGSAVKIQYLDPAGSVTNQLFPSGARQQVLLDESSVKATLIDVVNPFIFVDWRSLPETIRSAEPNDEKVLQFIERVRRAGAVEFGLAQNIEKAAMIRATPKIAVIKPVDDSVGDIFVTAYTMGQLHPALQLSGTACLAAAMRLNNTVPSEIYRIKARAQDKSITIVHRQGPISAIVDGDGDSIKSVSVIRTARRLFEGYYVL